MSILSANDSNLNQPSSTPQPIWKRILKQSIIAILSSGIILVLYLFVANDHKKDDAIGKHAYDNSRNEVYIGVIQGRGRKSGVKVFYIKQAGSTISVDERYVTIKDSAPKYD